MKENELLLKRNLRDEVMNDERLEVLDSVKTIAYLSNSKYSTIEQVADYYEVTKQAIESVVLRNKEELEANGFKTFSYAELKSLNIQTECFKIPNRGMRLFTKRAILNVGMLLQESEIAKEVRTLLLNNHFQLEDVHEKLKNGEEIDIDKINPTYFINKETELREQEKQLYPKMVEAISKGNMSEYMTINCEMNKIKENIIALGKEKEELNKSKVDFHDAVNNTSGTIKVGDFAKLLTKKGFKIGERILFKWLRENKILSDVTYNKNKPYQRYLDEGYFEMKENVIKKGNSEFITYTPLLTGKGQIYLEKKLREEFYKQAI